MHIYTYMYIYGHAHTHLYISMHIYTLIYTTMCERLTLSLSFSLSLSLSIYIYKYLWMYMHMLVYMTVHACIYLSIYLSIYFPSFYSIKTTALFFNCRCEHTLHVKKNIFYSCVRTKDEDISTVIYGIVDYHVTKNLWRHSLSKSGQNQCFWCLLECSNPKGGQTSTPCWTDALFRRDRPLFPSRRTRAHIHTYTQATSKDACM